MLPVASILTGLSTVGSLFRRSGSVEAAKATEPAPADPLASLSSESALQELASRHDLTKISPEDFSALARQLHQAGVINDRELQDLAAVRLELDLAELPPGKPVDVLAFLETKQQRLQGQLAAPAGGTSPSLSASDYNEAADRVARQLDFLREFQQARSGAVDTTV